MVQNLILGRIKGLRFKGEGIFLMIFVLTVGGLIGRDSLAASATYEEIQELEKDENISPPARIERPVVEYRSGHLKDPFQRFRSSKRTQGPQDATEAKSAKKKRPLPPLEIQGVVWGGIFPQAVVDNKVVKVGDTIKLEQAQEEIRIISIDKEGITVSFDEQNYKLSAPAGGDTSFKIPSGG
ncbi:MAG: hypothetical protein ABIG31_01840 [Candidatus Omnitrophota bacterium]